MGVHASARIGRNVVMGEQVVVEANAVIGDDVTIGHFAVIKKDTVIGSNCVIGDLCVLGKEPSANAKMARKVAAATSPLRLGDGVKIAAGCVVYRGVDLGDGVFVGDLASIRERVSVGEHSIIGRGAMVELDTVIGKRVTIQTGCYITADMIIEDGVFIGPRCSTSNDKYMGTGTYKHKGPVIRQGARIGNNATLLPGIEIGREAVVGAGAVVTKDVPAGTVVVGNPARTLPPRPPADS